MQDWVMVSSYYNFSGVKFATVKHLLLAVILIWHLGDLISFS